MTHAGQVGHLHDYGRDRRCRTCGVHQLDERSHAVTHDHRTMIGGPQDCHCAITRLADLGAFHTFRDGAEGIRDMIEHDLTTATVAVLDFEGVEAITGAWADELVAKLRADHGDRVRWEGANPEVEETIQTAIARRTTAPSTPNPRT